MEASDKGPMLETAGVGDTIFFGGTRWDAVDLRWEAIPDGRWTFESGVGSAINTDPAKKAVGLHSQMEGWTGVDLSLSSTDARFRRMTTCAISGSWSFWAGVAPQEADTLCYVAGQGYGNDWDICIRRTFHYPGSGAVTLSYAYAVDPEPGYDYTYVLVDTTGTGAADDLVLTSYTGSMSGTGSHVLTRGVTLPSAARDVTVKFRATSDGYYSDEDGLYETTCGHTAIDDIRLTGAIASFSSFETGNDGWVAESLSPHVAGDWSDIRAVADLPAPGITCHCDFQDSVLVFFDPAISGGGHPRDQDNVAMSPWIDLAGAGVDDRRGRFVTFEGYSNMPVANYIFIQLAAQWSPDICPAGSFSGVSKIAVEPIVYYYGESPVCLGAPCPGHADLSDLIPYGVDQFRIGIGLINLCSTAPFGETCTGITNTSPWIDNVRAGVFRKTYLATTEQWLPRDVLSVWPCLPTTTARFDCGAYKSPPSSYYYGTLGDTLVVRSLYASEVRVVFRVRPGPGIDTGRLNAWLGGLRAEGGGFHSARMDTAEERRILSLGYWMTAYHESDPNFTGRDTDPDPNDDNGYGHLNHLRNDIFPDNLFTPGTRVDLFYTATYPSSPGFLDVLPDTTGGRFYEMEVLPSSMRADGTQNRVLYVNHTDSRSTARATIEEALRTVLPGGSANFENTAWDRFDLPEGSSSTWHGVAPPDISIGFALEGYQTVIWSTGELPANTFTGVDAYSASNWLLCGGGGQWGGGGCGRGLYITGDKAVSGGSLPTYVNLGVHPVCSSYASAGCPPGSPADPSTCLAVQGEGAYGHFGGDYSGDLRAQESLSAACITPATSSSFDVLETHRRHPDYPYWEQPQLNLHYLSPIRGTVPGASVSSIFWNIVYWEPPFYTGYDKSVIDGFSIHHLRDAGCSGTAAVAARLSAVLDWFNQEELVPSGVPEAEAPPARPVLGNVAPNPFEGIGTARVSFGLPAAGPVRLLVFDVGGRLVRTLLDGPVEAGWTEAAWDGRDNRGRQVSSGLYFIRFAGGGLTETRKILLRR